MKLFLHFLRKNWKIKSQENSVKNFLTDFMIEFLTIFLIFMIGIGLMIFKEARLDVIVLTFKTYQSIVTYFWPKVKALKNEISSVSLLVKIHSQGLDKGQMKVQA